ncbi:fumarate hydratase class II [Bordetella ansorpii]|uniref:fumarate hydratase n=1 Tax=Bordetella ansorpii TaxID=288768 RepID=A0A157SRI9_9BORD|nr:lyase family protein [Bordetella ansorpii]SAI72921.1 fumarate hydratase class II [Bordetella ansorpii]
MPHSDGEMAAREPGKFLPRIFLDTLMAHKAAAAQANRALGALPDDVAHAIAQQAQALRTGFPDDPGPSLWQSGCGLETNRWANARIALACLRAGVPATPEQVNRNQSTNDTFPTVLQLSLLRAYLAQLHPACDLLRARLRDSAARMGERLVMGRTFLRDAKWMPLSQIVGGWADLVQAHHEWLALAASALGTIPLGGYSLGNGDGVDPGFAAAYAVRWNASEDVPCRLSAAPSSEMAGIRCVAAFGGALGALAGGIEKMAGDVLLLCSGPEHGFADLGFQESAADSTTLLGKSNPKQATTLLMACAYARTQGGLAVDLAARGQLAVFTGFPLLAHVLLDAVHVLAQQTHVFAAEFVPSLHPLKPAGVSDPTPQEPVA